VQSSSGARLFDKSKARGSSDPRCVHQRLDPLVLLLPVAGPVPLVVPLLIPVLPAALPDAVPVVSLLPDAVPPLPDAVPPLPVPELAPVPPELPLSPMPLVPELLLELLAPLLETVLPGEP
jgi:hypothetical protein